MSNWRTICGMGIVVLLTEATVAQTPGTAFTYQGRLDYSGVAANGPHDLRFRLWLTEFDTENPIGPVLCNDSVSVTDGLFTAQLDFGPNVFLGFPLWLEIEARADATPGNCASGAFAPLTPRQPLSPTPYAVFATTAQTAGLRLPFDGTSNAGILLHLTSTSNAQNTTTGFFENYSTGNNSRGLTAVANGSSGLTYGVYAQSNSSSGYGVYATSSGLVGVRGIANNTTGANHGVYGESASATGRGLFGVATSATGTNYGVYGQTSSPNGYAGYFAGGRNHFSGNVGIGTSSPDYKLEVTDTSSGLTSAMYVRNNGTAGAANFESLGVGGPPAVTCFKQDGTALLVTSTSSSTVTPLAVTGGSDSQPTGGGFIVCGSTNGTNVSIDNNEIMARNNGGTADLFLNNNGGNTLLNAAGAGNVGIGTAAPQRALDVAGAIRPQGGLFFNGALAAIPEAQGGNFLSFGYPGQSEDQVLYFQNQFVFWDSPGGGDTSHPELRASDFVTISDVRLKKNIRPIVGALDRVRSLRGIEYRYDGAKVDPQGHAPEPDRRRLGFAAQEVREVVPEAVSYTPELDVYGVSHGALVPLLVEAIKEQQVQIDDLKSQLAAMKAQTSQPENNR